MPSLVNLRKKFFAFQPSVSLGGDEGIVMDHRATLSPAEMVDQKLFALLRKCSGEEPNQHSPLRHLSPMDFK
jgi:hypothetical protein